MANLESRLEINTAIRNQKGSRKNLVLKVIGDLFKMQENSSDLSSKVKEDAIDETLSLNKISEELFEQSEGKFEEREEKTYGLFQQFSEYMSKVKDKLYGYYSGIKDALKGVKDALKVGYTDELLKEMEDWGYFHFNTVFRKLNRLTPLGAASRYLQELYVAMVKTIKH